MKFLRLNIKILKILMLWPLDSIPEKTNVFTQFFVHFLVDLCAINIPAYIIHVILQGAVEDTISLFETVIATVNWLLFRYISLVFWLNLPKIKKLLKDLRLFCQFCDEDVVISTERTIFKYTKTMLLFCCFGLLVNMLIPLYYFEACNENRYNDLHRHRNPCGLIFSVWLPFDVDSAPKYALVLICHLFACIYTACGTLAINMYLLGLLIHVIKQLENICKFASSEIFADSSTTTRQNISFFLKYHICIIQYTQRINQCFGRILIAYIFVPSIVLSILGYQVLRIDNVSDKIRYIWHITGWCILLFIICYSGQVLTDQSVAVADAVYSSDWYKFGAVNEKKKVVMILARSQESLKLKAVSLGIMSLEMFLGIMKTAYSYFALLYTVTEK